MGRRIGPFAIGGYNDTFTYDSSNFAFDNYTTGSLGSTPFDLDVYQGPTGSNSASVTADASTLGPGSYSGTLTLASTTGLSFTAGANGSGPGCRSGRLRVA